MWALSSYHILFVFCFTAYLVILLPVFLYQHGFYSRKNMVRSLYWEPFPVFISTINGVRELRKSSIFGKKNISIWIINNDLTHTKKDGYPSEDKCYYSHSDIGSWYLLAMLVHGYHSKAQNQMFLFLGWVPIFREGSSVNENRGMYVF
jgi:hypothetical protein